MNIADSLSIVKRHTSRAPVDVAAIAAEIGVPVVYEALDGNISGAIRASSDAPNGYEILVNQNHPLVRQRFTIAHELGHFIFHRDLLGMGTGDTRAYRAEPGTGYPNAHILVPQERQANAFAANVLMPRELIREFQKRGVTEPYLLAPIFKVSEQAMAIRLGVPYQP